MLNEVTFTGSVYDKTTGLQYMNARFYSPSTGRFLSQDAYSGNAYKPWTQHLYSYVGNNPINMVDPTGHWPDWLDSAIDWIKGKLNEIQEANEESEAETCLMMAKFAVKPGDPNYEQKILEQALKYKEINERSLNLVIGSMGGAETKIVSLIKNDSKLVTYAQQMGKNEMVQKEADALINKLIAGNGNPGKGTSNLFKGVYYLRGQNGSRIFYRKKDGVIEILAKADKSNEKFVIKALEKLYK